jgi:hypothetical protein
MTILVAIGLAALAACCFTGSVRLQHSAVRAVNPGESLSIRSLGRVIRSRRWFAGTALAVTGSGLHVVALSLAPLVVVQPIGVLSLVLITARFRPAVICVCLGIGGFVVLAAFSGAGTGGVLQPGPAQFFALAAIIIGTLAFRTHGRLRCLSLAIAAAMLYGTGSALIRAATQDISVAGLGLAAESILLIVAGGWLAHYAYAAGPPGVVVAVTTVVDPFTAVVIGLAFYGEAAHITPASAAGLACLAVLAATGVIVLARSIPDQRDPDLRDPERNPTCESCSRRTPSRPTSTAPPTSLTGSPVAWHPAGTTSTWSALPTPRLTTPTASSPCTR